MSLINRNQWDLKKLNYCAKRSCPKWNSNKFTRDFNQKTYLAATKKYWETDESQALISEYQNRHLMCVDITNETDFCYKLINTYPWPFSDPEFADWKELNNDQDALIYDQSGCIVKDSTSYVAWKIFETTGNWPPKIAAAKLALEQFLQYLATANYREIVTVPTDNGYYVGISKAFDLVVWYEGITIDHDHIICSTYKNRNYTLLSSHPDDFIWVKIK